MTDPDLADDPDRQEPLGSNPDYQRVLDVAGEYSFPCSDPIAVDGCCAGIVKRDARAQAEAANPADAAATSRRPAP